MDVFIFEQLNISTPIRNQPPYIPNTKVVSNRLELIFDDHLVKEVTIIIFAKFDVKIVSCHSNTTQFIIANAKRLIGKDLY
jgi:hypothetical protein